MPPIQSALQGLLQAENSLDRSADRIARRGSSAAPGDSVSLSDDAVSLITARNAYEMNLQTIKVSDQMTKKLLDILA